MSTRTVTLFISAATDEFRSYRDAMVKWLDRPGVRIETQERFIALGETILVKLDSYIKDCDAVVHLVGDRTGNEVDGGIASAAAVRALLDTRPHLLADLELTFDTVSKFSHTQWEAWLAVYHKRKLLIATPEPSAPRDKTLGDASIADAQKQSQQQHLSALAKHSRYPEIHFANSDQLCLQLAHLRDILSSGLVEASNIISLDQYRHSLTGFRRFLTSKVLPFQEPEENLPHHPKKVLQALETIEDGKGVLLAGAGGVGKTRTAFETACLAESLGWRVLYALPGEPAVTPERIIEAAFAYGPGRTLVVLEYLDQMPRVLENLAALRRYLVNAASERHVQIGLLANCRPGFLLRQYPERDALFDKVVIEHPASRAERLSRFIVAHTAPLSCQALGEDEANRLCGHRPIVALLVAQQLEELARDGKLDRASVRLVREGDLAHWLRKRLKEDELLTPQSASIYEPDTPPPKLVAAAAVLASAPDEESALKAAASVALESMGDNPAHSSRLVDVLRTIGWIEPDGPWLHAVHDVVTDELLDQALFDLDSVRSKELEAISSPSMASARSFGRMAKAFSRFCGSVSAIKASHFFKEANLWLTRRAEVVGRVLANDTVDLSSYALGAVVGGSVWEDGALSNWDHLILPWITKYGGEFEARHLHYRGLTSPNSGTGEALRVSALRWLEIWIQTREASFVIGPLLGRTDLPSEALQATLASAVKWLSLFVWDHSASWVLPSLIKKASREMVSEVAQRTSQWLERWGSTREAGYVFLAWLLNPAFVEEGFFAIQNAALEWTTGYRSVASGHSIALKLALSAHAGKRSAIEVNKGLAWIVSHQRYSYIGDVVMVLMTFYWQSPQVSNVCVACILENGWRRGLKGVKECVLKLLELLPEDDHRREELEALLENG